MIIRISTFDDNIAGRQEFHKAVDRLLGHFARRQHEPDDARRFQLRYDFFVRFGRNRAMLFGDQFRFGICAIPCHDAMAALEQPNRHIVAHATEPYHC